MQTEVLFFLKKNNNMRFPFVDKSGWPTKQITIYQYVQSVVNTNNIYFSILCVHLDGIEARSHHLFKIILADH